MPVAILVLDRLAGPDVSSRYLGTYFNADRSDIDSLKKPRR